MIYQQINILLGGVTFAHVGECFMVKYFLSCLLRDADNVDITYATMRVIECKKSRYVSPFASIV